MRYSSELAALGEKVSEQLAQNVNASSKVVNES